MKTILKSLRSAAKGLVFVSESEFPVVAVHWTESEFDSLDRTHPLDLNRFFEAMTTPQPWHDESERESVEQFQKLVGILQSLSETSVFRQGSDPVADVVVVGKAPGGGFVGVRTRVTET